MLLGMEAAMLSNRLDALLKESEEMFPPAGSEPAEEPGQNGHQKVAKSWLELYGFDKLAFVDAATAAGSAPPGAGMDPAAMGGAPPMDPSMDPAAMGGAPPMDPAAMGGAPPPEGALPPDPSSGMPPMDPAAMAAAGLPPPGGGAVDPATGQPLPPKVKVDTNAVLLQVLRLVALMADYLKIPVPASLMTIMPQELMSLPQQPPSGGGGGGGAAAPDAGAIPPIEPMEPMAPAMPKAGSFDALVGQAEALKLKQGW
jgi:hypothetical protein